MTEVCMCTSMFTARLIWFKLTYSIDMELWIEDFCIIQTFVTWEKISKMKVYVTQLEVVK